MYFYIQFVDSGFPFDSNGRSHCNTTLSDLEKMNYLMHKYIYTTDHKGCYTYACTTSTVAQRFKWICFSAITFNLKCRFLKLIGETHKNLKALIKYIFSNFAYVVIKAVIV